MTNEKLLEVALCGYLPYGVTAVMLDHKIDYVGKEIDQIIGIHKWSKNDGVCLLTDGGSKPSLKSVKLRLHPISCLTKPITVPNYNQGKEFVPIVELFHSMKYHKDVCIVDSYNTDENIHELIYRLDKVGSITGRFVFNSTQCSFSLIEQGKHRLMPYQGFGFGLMNQWLIDWRDLIGKGLAVEIID